MENQPFSTPNKQIFSNEQPDTFNSQTPSDRIVSRSLTDRALSSEVFQAPFTSDLVDPRSYAVRGFVLSCIGLAAWFIPTFPYLPILHVPHDSIIYYILPPAIAIGIICAAFIASICGMIFSIRGLQSYSKKGLAIAGLILSIIPLLIVLALLVLYIVLLIALSASR